MTVSDFRDDFPPPNEAKVTRELRDILDSAVRDEPPLFLDPAQIVAAGEIRCWRRRLGASVVLTVLAAVALVATAVPLAARHGSRSHAVGATDRATSTPVPATPAPSLSEPDPGMKIPATASPLPADPQVATHLTSVLYRIMPLRVGHLRPAPPGTKPMAFIITDGAYIASADVVDQLGYGHVLVRINAGGYRSILFGCGEQDPECFTQAGPNGAEVTIRASVQPAGGHDWMVTADRVDGVEVTVEVYDYTMAAAEKGSAPSQRDAPPLTVTQMVALATDPALAP
ncbi:MAG: hypothetical protein ACJ73S_18455 [Mycobacteriales bacterium]